MLVGLVLYVIYRRGQDKPLRKRFTIPAEALQEAPEVEYGSILVPVFGAPLDDDIVGTAGRLAAEEGEEGEGGAVIEALYVVEIPMSLPIDARVPDEQMAAGARGARAGQGGGRGVRGRRGGHGDGARALGRCRRSWTRPGGAGWRRSCWPPRSRRGCAAARSWAAAAGRATASWGR